MHNRIVTKRAVTCVLLTVGMVSIHNLHTRAYTSIYVFIVFEQLQWLKFNIMYLGDCFVSSVSSTFSQKFEKRMILVELFTNERKVSSEKRLRPVRIGINKSTKRVNLLSDNPDEGLRLIYLYASDRWKLRLNDTKPIRMTVGSFFASFMFRPCRSILSIFDKITIEGGRWVSKENIPCRSRLGTVPSAENIGRKKATLPTWDNVGAWRWLLCKWSSMLAISGAGAVMNPNLRPLLTTFENESSLITLPSVSNDKNDFGSTCACNAFQHVIKNCPRSTVAIIRTIISGSRTWNNI